MGSRLYRALVPPEDGELPRRVRAAGFVVIGKTSTPEFGLLPVTEPELFGPCRNPWDLSRTPGGSSGGSAAAVAAGIVPLAHASDGGGSIRIPASCCGLFGLKPSRGLPATDPAAPSLPGELAVDHALTRGVRDSAAFLDATRDRGPAEPPGRVPFAEDAARDPPRPLRVALYRGGMLGDGNVHPDCRAALDDAAALLADLGHAVEDAEPEGIDWPAVRWAFLVLFAASAARLLTLAPALVGRAARRSDVEITTWAMAAVHRHALTPQDTADALAVQAHTTRAMAAFHERFDVLLTPVLAAPPPPVGALAASPAEKLALHTVTALAAPFLLRAALARAAARAFGWAAFTAPFNLTGQPAASVPLFWNAAGLPIGVQLAAAHGADATLFRLAGQLERARPWSDRRPPLFPA